MGTTGGEHGGERSQRLFRSGELHLVLLALLAGRPQHGYELMTDLGTRFGPGYRPSAGSVYPALAALEVEGLVDGVDDGDRKVYRITPVGLEALDRRGELLGLIEARTGTRLRAPSLATAVAAFVARVRRVEGLVDAGEAEAVLEEAARDIEHLAR